MKDLLDEIYQYLDRPQRYGHYIACLCMFHDDSRPSMFIYPDTYKCQACGTFGKTKKLLETLQKKHGVFITKKETHFRSPWTNWDERYGELEHIIEQAHKNLLDHNKTAYLHKRCIDMETIRSLRLGWLDDWITFPVHNCTGKIIGGVARAGETNKSPAKYCNYPGMSAEIIYVPSWKMVQYSQRMYLTFGILDAVSLYQLGYASASTTTGKSVDPSAFDDIRKSIIIIPDDGEEMDAVRVSSQLGWRGSVMKVMWPEGCKDINDLSMKKKDYLLAIMEGQHGDNDHRSK